MELCLKPVAVPHPTLGLYCPPAFQPVFRFPPPGSFQVPHPAPPAPRTPLLPRSGIRWGVTTQKSFSISYTAPTVVTPPTPTPPTISTTNGLGGKRWTGLRRWIYRHGWHPALHLDDYPLAISRPHHDNRRILTGTAGAVGTYPFAVTVRDSGGLTNNSSLVLTVNP
jgi:hypothetical protein